MVNDGNLGQVWLPAMGTKTVALALGWVALGCALSLWPLLAAESSLLAWMLLPVGLIATTSVLAITARLPRPVHQAMTSAVKPMR